MDIRFDGKRVLVTGAGKGTAIINNEWCCVGDVDGRAALPEVRN